MVSAVVAAAVVSCSGTAVDAGAVSSGSCGVRSVGYMNATATSTATATMPARAIRTTFDSRRVRRSRGGMERRRGKISSSSRKGSEKRELYSSTNRVPSRPRYSA